MLETLVGPLKSGDAALQKAYEQALLNTDMRLLPITRPILREAATGPQREWCDLALCP